MRTRIDFTPEGVAKWTAFCALPGHSLLVSGPVNELCREDVDYLLAFLRHQAQDILAPERIDRIETIAFGRVRHFAEQDDHWACVHAYASTIEGEPARLAEFRDWATRTMSMLRDDHERAVAADGELAHQGTAWRISELSDRIHQLDALLVVPEPSREAYDIAFSGRLDSCEAVAQAKHVCAFIEQEMDRLHDVIRDWYTDNDPTGEQEDEGLVDPYGRTMEDLAMRWNDVHDRLSEAVRADITRRFRAVSWR
jgi:hypothetical protein